MIESKAKENVLVQAVAELLAAIQGANPDEGQMLAIRDKVYENDLSNDEDVPAWLLDLLSSLHRREPTEGWVRFRIKGLSGSNILDFIQELPEIVPMDFLNQEENWLLAFPALGMEATLSFEAYSYKVSELGYTWD